MNMDKVVLDGIEYVRASVIAKRFRYTADYVGQLCRSKKVDARLVGRSWYVNPLSMDEYRAGRHQKKPPEQASSTDVVKSGPISSAEDKPLPQRSVVASRLKSSTLKELATQEMRRVGEQRTLRVVYEPDHGNLIPTLIKHDTRPPTYVPVEPAESKKLGISNSRADRVSSFTPTEMPEVSLSGKVQVLDYSEEPTSPATASDDTHGDALPVPTLPSSVTTMSSRDTFKNKAISSKLSVNTRHNKSGGKVPLKNEYNSEGDLSYRTVNKKSLEAKAPENLPVGDPATNATLHRLDSVGQDFVGFAPKSITEKSVQTRTSRIVLFSPLIATTVAVVVVCLLFLSSLQVTVTNNSSDTQVVFQMASLLEFLQK